MAHVFLATDEVTGEDVVIKTLKREIASIPTVRQRAFREGLALARAAHPNVVRIIDIFEYELAVVLVLEFVDGGTLEDRIAETGPLPDAEARTITSGLLNALGAFHAHALVHRDVKPSNVLLTRDRTPKLTDLGVSLDASGERERLTKLGARIGTVQYMSPEQVKGKDVGAWTDVYAAGLVLFEMLTGLPPFQSENEFELADMHVNREADYSLLPGSVAPSVVAAIATALRKDPAARFSSVDEFRAKIKDWLG